MVCHHEIIVHDGLFVAREGLFYDLILLLSFVLRERILFFIHTAVSSEDPGYL